jgi:hypothetical protein
LEEVIALLECGMNFAWRVISSLTYGMLVAFVSGDIFFIHISSTAQNRGALGWYYGLSLLMFSSLMYLFQSEPLRFRKNSYLYVFVGLVAVCFISFLLFYLCAPN